MSKLIIYSALLEKLGLLNIITHHVHSIKCPYQNVLDPSECKSKTLEKNMFKRFHHIITKRAIVVYIRDTFTDYRIYRVVSKYNFK